MPPRLHSPRKLLHPCHAALYQPAGLGRLAAHLDNAQGDGDASNTIYIAVKAG
jgi:hypothetical protein